MVDGHNIEMSKLKGQGFYCSNLYAFERTAFAIGVHRLGVRKMQKMYLQERTKEQ